jgi:hypothetical protein
LWSGNKPTRAAGNDKREKAPVHKSGDNFLAPFRHCDPERRLSVIAIPSAARGSNPESEYVVWIASASPRNDGDNAA